MGKKKSKENLIINIADARITETYSHYQKCKQREQIIRAKRDLALNALAPYMGKPDFDKQVEKTVEEYKKELGVNMAETTWAYLEYQSLLCKKINTKPCFKKGEVLRKLPWFHNMQYMQYQLQGGVLKQGGVPECTEIDSEFTKFMGVRTFDQSLFDQIEILPDEDTASKVRVKIDGGSQTSSMSATWGLEITDDFLTDHCKLELGGVINIGGLVSISGGGSVRIKIDTFLLIYRLPDVALEDVNPAVHPVDYHFSSTQFASNEYLDTVPTQHQVALFEDQLTAQFLSNGLFVTAPEVDFSIVEPNYTLQAGDKIFVGFWFEFEANSSYLAFHMNDVGTTWMRPCIAHYKWQ